MTPLARRLAPILLVVAIRSADAQNPTSRSDTSVVPWTALTERPHLRDTAPAAGIHYPDMMLSARVAGDVRLEMVVGSDGQPERLSIHVISSTHDLFSNATQRAISEWRLTPPMANGRVVRAAVPVSVSFAVPSNRDEPSRVIGAVVVDSSGIHISLGRERVPPQRGLVAHRVARRAVTVAVLAELLPLAQSTAAAPICVSWAESPDNTPADVMRHLRALDPKVRNAKGCPPTYASMILRLDSLGNPVRPPSGAPDPMWISARDVRAWTSDVYVLNGFIRQGTGARRYFCVVRRQLRGAPWIAACEEREAIVH